MWIFNAGQPMKRMNIQTITFAVVLFSVFMIYWIAQDRAIRAEGRVQRYIETVDSLLDSNRKLTAVNDEQRDQIETLLTVCETYKSMSGGLTAEEIKEWQENARAQDAERKERGYKVALSSVIITGPLPSTDGHIIEPHKPGDDLPKEQ